MNNLYYIEYAFYTDREHWTDTVYGEMYCIDTGFGMLELGAIEGNRIYEEVYFTNSSQNIKEYINNFTGEVLSFTKVL